jgi:hypothetical protein
VAPEGILDAAVTCNPLRVRLGRRRSRLVTIAGGVERMHQPLVGITPLALTGNGAESPHRGRERQRQQQQSGDEPQASVRDSAYFLPPGPFPWPPCPWSP